MRLSNRSSAAKIANPINPLAAAAQAGYCARHRDWR
jgi:hypothetical protein